MTDYERYLTVLQEILAVGTPVAVETQRAETSSTARQRQIDEQLTLLEAAQSRIAARVEDCLKRAAELAHSERLLFPRLPQMPDMSDDDDAILRRESDLRRALRAFEETVDGVRNARLREADADRERELARRREKERADEERQRNEQMAIERREADEPRVADAVRRRRWRTGTVFLGVLGCLAVLWLLTW